MHVVVSNVSVAGHSEATHWLGTRKVVVFEIQCSRRVSNFALSDLTLRNKLIANVTSALLFVFWGTSNTHIVKFPIISFSNLTETRVSSHSNAESGVCMMANVFDM